MENSFKIASHLAAYNKDIVELNNYRNSLPVGNITSRELALRTMISLQSNIKGIIEGYNILSLKKVSLKKDIALFDEVLDEDRFLIQNNKSYIFTYLLDDKDIK